MSREFEQSDYGQIPEDSWGVPREILDRPEQFETQVPLLRRTLNFVRQYENSKPRGRESICEQIANVLLREPVTLKYVLGNLDLIGQLRPQSPIDEIGRQVILHVEQAAATRVNLSIWTPGRIERLVRLGLDSVEQIKQIIERLKATIFNVPRTAEESVDLHYNAAWAMVATGNPEVREELFSVLCYEKEWFAASSMSAFYFNVGAILTDDLHIGRHHSTNDAISSVGRFLGISGGVMPLQPIRVSARSLRMMEAQSLLSEDEQRQREQIVIHLIQKHKVRYEKHKKFVMDTVTKELKNDRRPSLLGEGSFFEGGEFVERVKEFQLHQQRLKNLPWPANIMKNPDEPLRVILDKVFHPQVVQALWEDYVDYARVKGYIRLTRKRLQITDDLELDILARGCESPEQRNAIVREVYETMTLQSSLPLGRKLTQSVSGVLDAARLCSGIMGTFDAQQNIKFALTLKTSEEAIGKLAAIIEYHRPLLSMGQIRAIEEQLSSLRQDLRIKFVRSVGKRGYQIVTADPILKQLDYQSITFRQDSREMPITVKIQIAGQDYEFMFDANYRVIPGRDIKKFQSLQDQLWLELLTLTHLKKVICTEEDRLDEALLGREKQVPIYRKQIIGRRDHLRRLPLGQRFSQDSFLRCLNSQCSNNNLHSINQERAAIDWGGTLGTGMWTYVSPVGVVDTPTTKPIKIAFANATEDLRKAVNLGKISDEELASIEREILGELEKES